MKDYYTLQPDKIKLLTRHFTRGRGGVKPNMIVRHHFAGIGDTDWLWRVWQDRPASAHYGVESGTDVVGQLVWDRDTAWHAANAGINRRSYGLEHGNITGRVAGNDNHPDSWKIADETIKGGARLAAALCLHDGMGVPEWGKNVTDHTTHYATSCPLKLARGGIYDKPWFEEATWFYDQLDKKLVHPDGTPISTFTTTPTPSNKGGSMFGPDQVAALHDAKVAAQEARDTARTNREALAELDRKVKLIEDQLLGPEQSQWPADKRNPNGGRGWPQLGENVKGQWHTLVDFLSKKGR